MLLKDRAAIVHGSGAIGAAVARCFAAEGAQLFLTARTLTKAEPLAREIAASGAKAEAAQVDATNEAAVEAHAADVVAKAGRIDILFNAIGTEDIQGIELLDVPLDIFLRPIVKAGTSQLLTARAAARHMVPQRSGVILTITAGPPDPTPLVAGFAPACGVIENLWRGFAAELAPHGVRAICIRSAGSPDTADLQTTLRQHAEAQGMSYDDALRSIGSSTLLKRLPLTTEVANAAAFAASDRASAMTGTFLHVTCGSPGG
jgi:3-oxoacyl-[acyl-carrier protein] reductase